ncbi:MAG: hypothetical protein J6J16_07945 [Lachnospiraceae bacterium]|nr:hypothetical protein [Lachnospiraceae bacterium]
MNKKRKLETRIFAWILSLVLCLAILPVNVAKAEPATISVYVSVSKDGDFVTSKDGEKVMYKEVTLTGKDSYTLSDVFVATHDAYYEGGATSGYSEYESAWGLSVGTLWGDTSGAYGYQINNGTVYVSGPGTAVNQGDYIHAYIYQDTTSWSDKYAYFESVSTTATTGVESTLTLKNMNYDASYNTIFEACDGASIYVNGTLQDGLTTDAEGIVKLTFDTAGTYTVVARGTTNIDGSTAPITPAYCTVVVSDTTVENPEDNQEENPDNKPEDDSEEEIEDTPVVPPVDKTVDEIVSSGMESCVTYMSATYGTEITFGYEWYVYNMLRAGNELSEETLDGYYDSVVAEVAKWENTQKPTDIARVALALSAMGKDITDVGGVNLAAMLYNHPALDTGSNELAYALLALDARKTEIPEDAKWTREAIISKLLTYQNSENGGFGLYDAATTSVDMTAIIVQALAPYKAENTNVATAIDKSVEYFKSTMSADYDFDGNSNSTAQVLMTMATLGVDPTVEANGFGSADNNIITRLYGYRVVDGNGYAYKIGEVANAYATVQVMQALNAYKLYKAGEGTYWRLPELVIEDEVIIDDNVNTGDGTPVGAIMLLCMVGAIGVIALRTKRENN